jgi:hypothetical protein
MAGISREWKEVLDARVPGRFKFITETIKNMSFQNSYKYLIVLLIFFPVLKSDHPQPPVNIEMSYPFPIPL